MARFGIVSIVQNIKLPTMNRCGRTNKAKTDMSLHERVQLLREKNSFPDNRRTVLSKRLTKGQETAQTSDSCEVRNKLVGTKNSSPDTTSRSTFNSKKKPTTSSTVSPVSRPPYGKPETLQCKSYVGKSSSNKAEHVTRSTVQCNPKKRLAVSSMKSPSECSPKKKSAASTPTSVSKKNPETHLTKVPQGRKSKTPINDRLKKYRETLLTDARNKTDASRSRAKRALIVTPRPSNVETQNNTKNLPKIPILGRKPKETKDETTVVPDPLTQDNYSPHPMEIDGSGASSTIEEMDWEINEMRKEFQDPLFTPGCETNSRGDSLKTLNIGGQWIVSIDTNVFISDLLFVQALRDTEIAGLGFPLIYVPHRVFCELDALKDRAQVKSESVAKSARKAVTYLNTSLIEKHPRIKGQSISDYIAMKDLVDVDADDKILLSCLQLKKLQPDKFMVFISNDINLRNKALIEDIEAYSVEKFKELFLENDDPSMTRPRLELRLKDTIRVVLTEIFETESKSKIKSNNSLLDVIDCFVQKWGYYFSSKLPVPAEEHLQKIRTILLQEEQGLPSSLCSLIDVAKQFITNFYIKRKVYFNSVEKSLKVLSNLRPASLNFDNGPQEEKHLNGALEAILRLSWDKMYYESDAINKARETGDPSCEIREQHFLQSLRHFIDTLGKVMATSLFDISSSPDVNDLAEILASCTEDEKGRIKNILIHVCSTIEGRNMIANAFKIFQRAYSNCNTGNHQ